MQFLRFVTFVGLVFVISPVFAQDTVMVMPGEDYEAGFLHRMLFGSGWRDLWTTPVVVDPIDVRTFAGGLVAGKDSYANRFRGRNGNEYIFHSFDKSPKDALDPLLLKSVSESVATDLVSSLHPVAPLIISPLLDAAGLASASPMLVQTGDASGILLEHLPQTPIISTDELLALLDTSSNDRVNARAYLAERLMDVFLAEWDRGTDRWEWTERKQGGTIWWSPAYSDRVHALNRINGLGGITALYLTSNIASLSGSYTGLKDLVWNARHTDRRFLSGLDKAAWDEIASTIQDALTDGTIESAVRQMPATMYEKEGESIVQILKSRRDKFKDAVDRFYRLLAEEVDIWATDQSEYADIERVNNDSVIVSLFQRDNTTGGTKGKAFFRRTFSSGETCEMRLYLQGGDDFAIVRGGDTGSIRIRIIGGEGADELADSSTVYGNILGVLPIKTPRAATYFYENDRKAEFIYGPSTCAMPDDFHRPAEDSLKWEPLYRDWGQRWRLAPWLGYNSDDGVFLGAVAKLTHFGFRSIPYHDQATFKGGYAFGGGIIRLAYEHSFPNILNGTLDLHARTSINEVVHFFGFGNDSKFKDSLYDADHFDVRQFQFVVQPSYAYSPLEGVTIRGTAGVRYFSTDTSGLKDSSIVKLTKPYGIENATYAIAGISGTYDSRDNVEAPQKGVYFTLGSLWNPEIFSNNFAYTKGYSEFRGFYTAPVLEGATVAVRARGEKIFGNRFPFYESSFLGGTRSLRGYVRERFAGDACVLATLELRLNIAKLSIIVPGSIGVYGFVEEGRVFFEDEKSEARHGSFGGGIWGAPLGLQNTIVLTIARSPEQTRYSLTTGFTF